MQNKKTLYVLLPAVLLIWGLIIYRIVDALTADGQVVSKKISPVSTVRKTQEVYALTLDYPDPFLGHRPVSKLASESKKTQKYRLTPSKGKVAKERAPKLRYNGHVENLQSSSERHMVTVNGTSHIITLNELFEEVKLTGVYSDSVRFEWNGQTIYVKR